MSRILRRASLVALLAIIALAAPIPSLAAPGESCVNAKITAPFWLPDGQLHAPGTLTLCVVREFSPISNLHRLAVDGNTVGVYLSRKRVAEAADGIAPEVVFERDGAGNLKLLGYSLPERERVLAFRLPAANPAREAPALARVP